MRLPFISIITAILHFGFCLPATTIAADDKATEKFVLALLEESGRKVNLSVITPENKEAVVALLRDIATRKRRQIGTTLPDYISAKIILLRLGDPPTMQDSADAYLKTGRVDLSEISLALQPAMIPLLVDGLRFDERDNVVPPSVRRAQLAEGTCVRPISPSFRATHLIQKLLVDCPQFTGEVRASAMALLKQPIPSMRETLRVWWKENEMFFKTGHYNSVRPPTPQAATDKKP